MVYHLLNGNAKMFFFMAGVASHSTKQMLQSDPTKTTSFNFLEIEDERQH
jgi:hypothetical protein